MLVIKAVILVIKVIILVSHTEEWQVYNGTDIRTVIIFHNNKIKNISISYIYGS